MDTYYARLTWNPDGWMRPAGPIRRGEHGTYVAKHGFGHEEWLNRGEWVVDGWRYGYIEGARRSARLEGLKVRLWLFAVTPDRERVVVGKIDSAEILSDEAIAGAHKAFRRHGWLEAMITDVEERVGPSKHFGRSLAGGLGVANIRFRPTKLEIFSSPRPVPRQHVLWRYSRYGLMAAGKSDALPKVATRRPMVGPKATTVASRHATGPVMVDPVEARMQNQVRKALEAKHGAAAVKAEQDFVDIRVTIGKKTTFIELKSTKDSRKAIRQALGQLLDYAFFQDGRQQVSLLVVGRGLLDGKTERYIETLRRRFRLPIDYRQYVLGSHRFES